MQRQPTSRFTSTDDAQAAPAGGPSLKRALGPAIAMAVVVGNVIGSGIFLKPGQIAADGGHFGLIIAVWVLGGLLCLLGALCYCELATMLPRAGGLFVYLREAFGNLVGFLFAWNELLFSRPAAIGALAVAFSGSLTATMQSWWASDASWSDTQRDVVVVILATVLISAMAWVNILGVLWGGRVQLVTTVIKAAGLGLIAATPFVLLPFRPEAIDWHNYATTIEPAHADWATRVGLVLLAVMWAYNGWHGVTPLAEEIRDPHRNIPVALFGGIGLLIVLYVAANLAYHGVLSMEEMRAGGERASELMLKKLFGLTGLTIMSSVIMCSTFGAINTNLLQAPRITFAMGREGLFFRALGQVHATYRTPAVAIAVMAVMAIALVAGVALAKFLVRGVAVPDAFDESSFGGLRWRIVRGLQDGTIFQLLTNFVIFSMSIFYVLAVLAVIVLRVRRPHWPRPYRTWGYPLVPLAFVAVYIWFLWQIYRHNVVESRAGLVLILLGVPVYFAYQRYARNAPAGAGDRNQR